MSSFQGIYHKFHFYNICRFYFSFNFLGLSKCRREQAEAMEKNMRMRPEREQLALFIKGLKEYHRAPEEKEKDEYDGDARDMKDLEMDEEDYGEYEDWTEGKIWERLWEKKKML